MASNENAVTLFTLPDVQDTGARIRIAGERAVTLSRLMFAIAPDDKADTVSVAQAGETVSNVWAVLDAIETALSGHAGNKTARFAYTRSLISNAREVCERLYAFTEFAIAPDDMAQAQADYAHDIEALRGILMRLAAWVPSSVMTRDSETGRNVRNIPASDALSGLKRVMGGIRRHAPAFLTPDAQSDLAEVNKLEAERAAKRDAAKAKQVAAATAPADAPAETPASDN